MPRWWARVTRQLQPGITLQEPGELPFLQRPSLAYRAAFDLCATQAARAGGPTFVLASSPFYACEVVRRLNGQILLHFPRNPGLGEAETRTALGPEMDWARLRVASSMKDTAMAERQTLAWAEPERDTCRAVLASLRNSGPRAVLVLGTSWLRRLLPEWQAGEWQPAAAPVGSMGRITEALRRAGYAVRETYGFHGPRSLLWGTASRLPAALGRDDLVDRWFAAMRRAYVVRGWQARWAPVWMIVGELRGDGRNPSGD
jgi:hypothetical protein